ELLRSHVQLSAEAYLAQGGMLPEAIELSLREALATFPDDKKLLALLRSVLLARAASFEGAEVQERIWKLSPDHRKEAERSVLLKALARAGDEALARGDLAAARSCARKAKAADPEAPLAGILFGRLEELEGNPRGAIRQWGRTRSHEALALMGSALSRH